MVDLGILTANVIRSVEPTHPFSYLDFSGSLLDYAKKIAQSSSYGPRKYCFYLLSAEFYYRMLLDYVYYYWFTLPISCLFFVKCAMACWNLINFYQCVKYFFSYYLEFPYLVFYWLIVALVNWIYSVCSFNYYCRMDWLHLFSLDWSQTEDHLHLLSDYRNNPAVTDFVSRTLFKLSYY